MATTLTQFSASDDLLHDEFSSSGSHARESLALAVPLPGEELAIMTYVWREGGDRWGRFVFVAGPEMAKPEYVSLVADGAYSGENLRDFEVSGLRWSQPDPLRTAQVGYRDGGLELDIAFEALHPPFSWHDNPDGCPDWVAHNRYEQCGRTRVRLILNGRQIEVDSMGHRDHSWGPRNWAYLQHWKWINCATVDGRASVHCMVMNFLGRITVNGYLNVEGAISPIVSARADAELDEAMCHRRVTGAFVDELGRTMNLDARYAAGWAMPIGHLFLHEEAMTATLDGAPAISHIELGWPQDYVKALTGA